MSKPLTREFLLARGKCCNHSCKNCPYKYMYNLFLDDIRQPHYVTWVNLPLVEWVVVKNAEEFIAYIKLHGVPTRISFDHDLGPEHYSFDWSGNNTKPEQLTGYDCVKWLCEYCNEHNCKFPEYYLHTMNNIGLQNMRSYIQSYIKSKNSTSTTNDKPNEPHNK